MYNLVELRFLSNIRHRQWTKYSISTWQRNFLENKNNGTMQNTLCLNKCSMKYLFIIPSLSRKYNFHRYKNHLSRHVKCVKCCHDDVILTSALRLIFVYKMPWRIYQALTMHATVSNWHFLRSFTFLDNLKLLID